ncbi:MAG: hypothetical protein PHR49_07325 [Methanoculleus sp.]|nr:hypothetical protein [Methanoculleus sp.]
MERNSRLVVVEDTRSMVGSRRACVSPGIGVARACPGYHSAARTTGICRGEIPHELLAVQRA